MNPQDPTPSNRPPSLYQMSQPERKGGAGGLVALLLLALLLAGGGAYYYFQVYKKASPVVALPAAATPVPHGAGGSPAATPAQKYNSVTEQSYIDQADEAFKAVQKPKAQAFSDAFAAFKAAGYVNAVGLGSKEGLDARRALLARCVAANDDYAAFVAGQEAFYKEQLAKTPLTPVDAQRTFDGFAERARTADVVKLRQAQHDYLQACDDMLAALQKWQGNWSVTPAGKLALKRKENIAEFNELAQKTNVKATAVTQLQNDFNAALDPAATPGGSPASGAAAPGASPATTGAPASKL